MQKYGNFGVLMVAAYLGLRYLWRERVRVALIGLALSGACFGFLMTHRSRRVVATPLASVSVPKPLASDSLDLPEDKLEDAKEMRDGRDIWRVEIWRPREIDDLYRYVKFYKNGRLVQKIQGEEQLGSPFLRFGEADFKTRSPLIILEAVPPCDHPDQTTLFTIRQGKLIRMAEVGGMNGGPVFRDYDGDGRPEWVFDDYYYHVYPEGDPKRLLVYKERKDGTLKLWKSLPNRKRLRLPDRLGRGLE